MGSRTTVHLALVALLCACGNEQSATTLPKVEGTSYRTFVTYYSDEEGSAWRPFKIETAPDQSPNERRHVIFAEQCEDVSVVQTQTALYIFYGEIAAREFSSMTYQQHEPEAFLCDLSLRLCQISRDALLRKGSKVSRVCPTRTPDGQPGN